MAKNANFCEVPPDVEEKLKKFRFSQTEKTAALILKINKDDETIKVDEEHLDTTIEDLKNELPDCQPRFLVMTTELEYDDKRKKYPLCLIYWSPRACPPHLHLLYSSSLTAFVKTTKIPRVFTIRDSDEFTDEWFVKNLKKFG